MLSTFHSITVSLCTHLVMFKRARLYWSKTYLQFAELRHAILRELRGTRQLFGY